MWKQISLATHCMHFVWSRERETGDWQRGEGEHFIAKASHAFEAQQQGDLRSIAIKMIYYWSSWSTLIFNFLRLSFQIENMTLPAINLDIYENKILKG